MWYCIIWQRTVLFKWNFVYHTIQLSLYAQRVVHLSTNWSCTVFNLHSWHDFAQNLLQRNFKGRSLQNYMINVTLVALFKLYYDVLYLYKISWKYLEWFYIDKSGKDFVTDRPMEILMLWVYKLSHKNLISNPVPYT